MKTCTHCKEVKPNSDFNFSGKKSKAGKRYRQSYCKKCSKERKRKWAKENRDKINEYEKSYRKTESGREMRREQERKQREEVSAWYARRSLTKRSGLATSDLPIELVKLWQTKTKLERELKNGKNKKRST